MPELMSSLAVLGVDGTGRRRLKDSPLGGRAHIKTGSLAGVSALSGYVLDRAGRRWVVVVLINQPGIENWQAKAVQDALLLWVHDGAAQAAAPGRSPRPELSGAAAGAGQAR
jgi:D-alanyl-D-alanine carboxypeptidase/D-alanyl-D-alanine-endopeptidase (penicillin-binding protein 4)